MNKPLVFHDKGYIRLAPAQENHIESAIALLAKIEQEDKTNNRHKRLGPASPEYLREALDENQGLSIVAIDDQDELVGCAFVAPFEKPLRGSAHLNGRECIEAAKMAVATPLRSTGLADLLHSIRIVEIALAEQHDQGFPKLIFNVLEKNEAQLDHIRRMGLEDIDLKTGQPGELGEIIDSRIQNLQLDGQKIKTFGMTDLSVKVSVRTIFAAMRDRVLLRPAWLAEGSAGAVCWGLDMDSLPNNGPQLFRLLELCEKMRIDVPQHVRDVDRQNHISFFTS